MNKKSAFNEDQGNVIRVYMVGIKFISTNKYELPKRRVINVPMRLKKT